MLFKGKKKWTETGTFQPKKLVSRQVFFFSFLIGVLRVKLTWSVTSEVIDSSKIVFFSFFSISVRVSDLSLILLRRLGN